MKHLVSTFALACLLANAGPSAHAADFSSTIAEARDNIENSQFSQALEAARRARAQNPKAYQSYYYEAMALLGLGQKAEAQQAVQAAQERAPDSAKATLDKLAQMVSNTGQEATKNAAPATGVVFVKCDYRALLKRDNGTTERTSIRRIERDNYQIWDDDRAEWMENICDSKTYEFAKSADLVFKCEINERLFSFSSRYTTNHGILMKENWSINRLSGKYHSEDNLRTDDGSCRPVNDPSALQNRKF